MDSLDGIDDFMSEGTHTPGVQLPDPTQSVQPPVSAPAAQPPPYTPAPVSNVPQQLRVEFPPMVRPGDAGYEALAAQHAAQRGLQVSPPAPSSAAPVPPSGEPGVPPVSQPAAPPATPQDGTVPVTPVELPNLSGTPPPVNPNILQLSTMAIDVTGMAPSEVAKLVRHDEVLKKFQSENTSLRRGANNPPQAQQAPQSAAPSSIQLPASPTQSAPGAYTAPAPQAAPAIPYDIQLKQAWEAYQENANEKTMGALLAINNAKIQAESAAAYQTQLRATVQPLLQAVQPLVEERANTAREKSLNYAIETKIGELVSYGVDCKTLAPTEVQAYFNKNAQALLADAARDGSQYDYSAVFDPAIMPELVAMSVREALDGRRALAQAQAQTKVSPQVQTPVAPQAPVGQVPAPFPLVMRPPLPTSAPGFPSSVPGQLPGSQAVPGATPDPWAHVTPAHAQTMSQAELIRFGLG